MNVQSAAFLQLCGDLWFKVNEQDLGKSDPVSRLMEEAEHLGYRPERVYEIGCSNGWRLKKIRERYGCWVGGLDPSAQATASGNGLNLSVGLAHEVHALCPEPVDTLIYGYCFAYIDPEDYFSVLASGDRMLKDGGFLFLHDRAAPYPVKRHYAGLEGTGGEQVSVMSHEMNFSQLWTAHPFYIQIGKLLIPDKYEVVNVLKKDIEGAFAHDLRTAHYDVKIEGKKLND